MNKEISAKLKERAVVMAVEAEQTREVPSIEVITFTLASEEYCIETSFVKEVCPLKDFTPLPGVPKYVLGIINLRGQIIPVIDLKKFFNFPEKGLGELNKVIVLHNEQMEFGLLTDVVNGIKNVPLEDILTVPPTVTGIGEEYLKGVTTENLIVLNAEILLSDERIVVYDDAN